MHNVAILLATFNGQAYISTLLDSIIKQTYKNYVCYIHDDGSTDNTLNIIDRFIEKYPDKFILWRYDSSGSAKGNFISMLQRVKEPYVMFCDQDDVWFENKVEKTLSSMEETIKQYGDIPIVVFSDLTIVESDLNVIAPSFMEYTKKNPANININKMLMGDYVAGCTMMMNKRAITKSLEHLNIEKIEMHDLWISLVTYLFGKLVYIDEPLIFYRQHENNVCGIKHYTVLDNLKRLLSGKIEMGVVKRRKQAYAIPRNRASELAKYNDLPTQYNTFIKSFAELTKQGKIKKIRFYIKHNLINARNILDVFLWI